MMGGIGRPRLGLVLAALAVIVLLGACNSLQSYYGEPLDRSAANIVPTVGDDAATIATEIAPGSRVPGVEGSVLFIRLMSHGGVVLDRPFAMPLDEQPIPPGSYQLVAYWRTCSGNCGTLDDEAAFCEAALTIPARTRALVTITARDLLPGSSCIVAVDA